MYRPHAVIHSSDGGHLGCFHCISNHFQAFLQRLEKLYISQEKRKEKKRKEKKRITGDIFKTVLTDPKNYFISPLLTC